MSIDGYRIRHLTPDELAHRDHDLTNCHDIRHNGLDCPTCDGVKIACRTHKTPSTGSAKTDVTSVAVEARTPGREVEERSPALPSRPDVTPEDRVTYTSPFAVDRTITADSIHLVTFALTDDATHTHVRDLYSYRALLLMYFEMRQQAEDHRIDRDEAAEARRIATTLENRLAGALTSHATTQWELPLSQAEQLLEDLDDAATEPETCAVGTCTGYATNGGSYCASHDEAI